MKAVNLRPFATFCLSFFISAIILCTAHFSKLPYVAACLILAVLLFFVSHKLKKNLYFRSAGRIAVALAASLAFTYFTIDTPMKKYEALSGEHTASGKICDEVWTNSYGSGYLARITELDGEPADFKVALDASDVYAQGDTFSGRVTLSPLTSPAEFNSRRYYLSLGAFLSAEGTDIEYTGKDISVNDRLDNINEALSARFVILMGERNGGLTASMFLGNRDYLQDDFFHSVKNLGLAHVIALSGMHLTVICAMLSIFLSNINAKASRLCAIPIVAFYIIITGFFASIVRAGIMLACYNLISFTKRSSDQPTNLGISAVLIVLFDPASLFDLGFQLSVAAMLGVFATLKIMGGSSDFESDRKRAVKAILLPVVMSFISMAFTMIIVVVYFGYITPAAIIATVPFAWFGDLILWMSPFVLLLGQLPLVGSVLCTLCSFPCIAFDRLAIFFGRSSKVVVSVRDDYQIWLAILFSIFFMAIFVIDSKRVRRIAFAISMVFLAGFIALSSYIGWREYNSVRLDAVYESSGEGFVLSFRDDCIAIDISNGSRGIYKDMAEYAFAQMSDDIDCLVITNPHPAHASGMSYLRSTVKVRAVYMPDEADSHLVALQMPEDIEIFYYQHGDVFEYKDFKGTTYEDEYLSRSVVPIIRLKIETQGSSFFYLGASAEEAGIEPEKSDILWRGCYGPKYKSIPRVDYPAKDIRSVAALEKYLGELIQRSYENFVLYSP